jgi:Na+-translocating ferredoxin:NAD+ oxidoreductase RnfD subunit
VLNPTNGAIVLALLVGAPVWVSPGQWGNVAFFAFFIACIGTLTVTRAARVDVVVTFLLTWAALVIGRSLYLGEPMAIPLHRLQSGALLLFAFFMISDPKTTPDARVARVVFAVAVALGAYVVQFRWFRTNGLLWSLSVCCLAVPVLDALFRAARFSWAPPSGAPPPAASVGVPA